MNFEDIRPYNDEEIPAIVKQLVNDKQFAGLIGKIYQKPEQQELVLNQISQIETVEDFQTKVIVPVLARIVQKTTHGITYGAMEQFNPNESHLIISNHRDIILDPSFLNYLMHKNQFGKTENAIGDNLLIFDWINKLAKINRCFVVKRSLGIREQLAESKKLSAYIRYCITQKQRTAWIAQKEGRSKDGNDQTNTALLKMLDMSSEVTLTEGFKQLNIIPMAISYEIEPCGVAKVREMLTKKHNPDFKKREQDDLHAMANGIMQPKGRVHYGFGNPVNLKIEELTEGKSKNDALKAIAQYIDMRVYFNYKLWPNNYIAYDLLHQSEKHSDKYTAEEKANFKTMMDKDISTLDFTYQEASEQYLTMYATPVINFEKHFC